MIIIGGGFSDENMRRIAEQVERSNKQFDVFKFSQFIHEVFGKMGAKRKKEISGVKNCKLTPDQLIAAENLRRRVQEILNRPPAIRNPY